MPLPHVTAVGNLTADPELKFTASGVALLELRLACNERKKDGDRWVDGRTTFVKATLWRDAAEQAASELTKGMEVIVHGRLVVEEYEKDGQTRQSVKIDADTVARTYGRRPVNHRPTSTITDEEPF